MTKLILWISDFCCTCVAGIFTSHLNPKHFPRTWANVPEFQVLKLSSSCVEYMYMSQGLLSYGKRRNISIRQNTYFRRFFKVCIHPPSNRCVMRRVWIVTRRNWSQWCVRGHACLNAERLAFQEVSKLRQTAQPRIMTRDFIIAFNRR